MYRLQAAAESEGEAARRSCSAAARSSTRCVAAQKLLEKYDVAADVWSVTSYQELYRDGHACDRWNMLHPAETPRVPYVAQCLKDAPGVLVAASDYLKVLPDSIDQWMPRRMRSLGTDGFGRSEDRQRLREFFEVDARFVALATLAELAQDGQLDRKVVAQAIKDLGHQPGEAEPGEELADDSRHTDHANRFQTPRARREHHRRRCRPRARQAGRHIAKDQPSSSSRPTRPRSKCLRRRRHGEGRPGQAGRTDQGRPGRADGRRRRGAQAAKRREATAAQDAAGRRQAEAAASGRRRKKAA